jgi:hypothetical protein
MKGENLNLVITQFEIYIIVYAVGQEYKLNFIYSM